MALDVDAAIRLLSSVKGIGLRRAENIKAAYDVWAGVRWQGSVLFFGHRTPRSLYNKLPTEEAINYSSAIKYSSAFCHRELSSLRNPGLIKGKKH